MELEMDHDTNDEIDDAPELVPTPDGRLLVATSPEACAVALVATQAQCPIASALATLDPSTWSAKIDSCGSIYVVECRPIGAPGQADRALEWWVRPAPGSRWTVEPPRSA
jgi:hypothetical protein